MIWFGLPTLAELTRASAKARLGRDAPEGREPLLLIDTPEGPQGLGFTELVYIDIRSGKIAGTEADDFDISPAFDPKWHYAALVITPNGELAGDISWLAELADKRVRKGKTSEHFAKRHKRQPRYRR